MSQDNEKKEKTSYAPLAIPAIMGAIATIAAAYFSYSAGVNAIKIPLNATQTAEARQSTFIQTATLSQPSAIATVSTTPELNNQEVLIEKLPAKVYVRSSYKDSEEVKSLIVNNLEIFTGLESGIAYKHSYSFPANSGGAGLYFQFDTNIDLSEYQAMGFSITKRADDKIQFALSGGDKNQGIFIGENLYGLETGITGSEGDFIIPIKKNFPDITTVNWLYFWISPPGTQGSIEYEVSNLRFIK